MVFDIAADLSRTCGGCIGEHKLLSVWGRRQRRGMDQGIYECVKRALAVYAVALSYEPDTAQTRELLQSIYDSSVRRAGGWILRV